MGTPLIITDLPVLDELGCTPENSIVLDFDMSNLDVKDIYNRAGTFKFSYKQKESKWLDLLEGESTYTYVEPETVRITAVRAYYDVQRGDKLIKAGTTYETTRERAEKIIGMGYAKYYEGD